MRAVIQRTSKAHVEIDSHIISSIGCGILVFLGIETEDEESDIEWLANKIVGLRIFDDESGVMNRNIVDIAGEVMIISQFTLYASTKKGRRPSYLRSAKPDKARPLYDKAINIFENIMEKSVARGKFGADMKVSLTNDGPVTIIIDTKNRE